MMDQNIYYVIYSRRILFMCEIKGIHNLFYHNIFVDMKFIIL